MHPSCHHAYYLIDCVSFDGLLARSAGRCEVCAASAQSVPGQKLLIDHDHALGLGAVRGLVCPACNHLLGRVDAGAAPPLELAASLSRYLADPWVVEPPPDLRPALSRPRLTLSGDMPARDLRARLADVLNDAAVRGKITYVTSRGRRIAAVVPLPVAERAEAPVQPRRQGSGGPDVPPEGR
jgi:prevent-host-death family protein